jgi:hypothetical protein
VCQVVLDCSSKLSQQLQGNEWCIIFKFQSFRDWDLVFHSI